MKFQKVDRSKGKSPYVRGNKAPYVYRFRTCSHRSQSGRLNSVRQQVVTPHGTWRGECCGTCNIILKCFEEA